MKVENAFKLFYDVSGGGWDDLVEAIRKAFYAGWNARYETLTNKDI